MHKVKINIVLYCMRVKGQKQLNTALSKWLRKQGFPLHAVMSSDFMFIEPLNTITYSFIVTQQHEELFLKVCKTLCPELVNCDTFILSFFHEIGHYMTTDMFSNDEYQNYLNTQEEINYKQDLTEDDYLQYYMCDVERVATEWALDYIMTHKKTIQKFGRKIYKLQRKFLKKNNVIIG